MARPEKVRELSPRLRDVLRYFWPYTRRYRALMAGSLLAIIAEVFLRLLEPWMLALVLDYVVMPPQSGAKQLPIISSMEPMTILLWASVGLVVAVGLRALAVYASKVSFALIGNRVLTEVRGDLYRHLHSLSMSYHNKARKGDLTVRVIGDIGLLKDVVVTAMPLARERLGSRRYGRCPLPAELATRVAGAGHAPPVLAVDGEPHREDPQGLGRPATTRGLHGVERL